MGSRQRSGLHRPPACKACRLCTTGHASQHRLSAHTWCAPTTHYQQHTSGLAVGPHQGISRDYQRRLRVDNAEMFQGPVRGPVRYQAHTPSVRGCSTHHGGHNALQHGHKGDVGQRQLGSQEKGSLHPGRISSGCTRYFFFSFFRSRVFRVVSKTLIKPLKSPRAYGPGGSPVALRRGLPRPRLAQRPPHPASPQSAPG
jgi:hypothetical protein